MVRLPEPMPPYTAPPRKLLDQPVWPELLRLFGKVNKEYLYWDKFKQQRMPDGVKPEDAWNLLKLTRGISKRETPCVDRSGHRYWYSRTEEIERVLHVIDQQAGGRVTTSVERLSTQAKKRYLVSSLMEEAIASSQIEGAATTRRVAKEMLRTQREPVDRAERMILNNYATMTLLGDLLDEPFSLDLILDIQQTLTQGALDHPEDCGRYRCDDDVVVAGDEGSGGQVLHVPPSAKGLHKQMMRLCDYANQEDGPFEHPVVKATVLHFWLAYLHPFADGNGRTARAVFHLYLLKHGYWLFEYLSISKAILDRRSHYYKAFLYSEVDECDLTYFLTFNLHAVERALDALWVYLGQKSHDESAVLARVKDDRELNYRQRALLSRALREPDSVFTIESHRQSHGVSYGTSRNDLLTLAERGYLVTTKRGKEFVFRPAENLGALLGSGG